MEKHNGQIRVLIAVPGFDGHWRGAMTVTAALRDAGMEVIYVGNQQPEALCEMAIQEDVDVVGLSIFSAGYMRLVPRVLAGLRAKGAKHIMVILGGIILPEHIKALKDIGIAEIFLPGGKTESIINFIRSNIRKK